MPNLLHVADFIKQLASTRPSVLIAIDGFGGAGKSTLASALATETGAAVIQTDDFYRVMDEGQRAELDPEEGYRQYIHWERLRDQVLEPLRSDSPAIYRRYEWTSGKLGDWRQVDPRGTIIIEGVYTCRPELLSFYDVTIFLRASRELCLSRLRNRGENPEIWIQRWAAAEDWYLENELILEMFDFIMAAGPGESAAVDDPSCPPG